jgi:hypothetical protein
MWSGQSLDGRTTDQSKGRLGMFASRSSATLPWRGSSVDLFHLSKVMRQVQLHSATARLPPRLAHKLIGRCSRRQACSRLGSLEGLLGHNSIAPRQTCGNNASRARTVCVGSLRAAMRVILSEAPGEWNIGSARTILQDMMKHLCSSISYGGASSLAELRSKFWASPDTYLIRQSSSSRRESYER